MISVRKLFLGQSEVAIGWLDGSDILTCTSFISSNILSRLTDLGTVYVATYACSRIQFYTASVSTLEDDPALVQERVDIVYTAASLLEKYRLGKKFVLGTIRSCDKTVQWLGYTYMYVFHSF